MFLQEVVKMRVKRTSLVVAIFLLLLLPIEVYAALPASAVPEVWQRLAKAANLEKPGPISIVKQKEPNAWVSFSVGSYSVSVTTGMLDLLDSEDELAGVLAHELGHVKLNHYGSTVGRGVLYSLIFRAIGYKGSSGIDPVELGLALAEAGFSREQEVEADDYGIELATKAGYDPWGLVRALEKMKAAGYTTSPNGFNSHPPTDRRLQHVRQTAQKFAPAEAK